MNASAGMGAILAFAVYAIVALAVASVIADLCYAVSRGFKDWREP